MKLKKLLSNFAKKELNIDKFPFEDNGIILSFGKEFPEIIFEEKENGRFVYIFSYLYKLPKQEQNKTMKILLQSHMFGEITNECYFSINPANDNIFIFKIINLEKISQEIFDSTIKTFIENSLKWKRIIEKISNRSNDIEKSKNI